LLNRALITRLILLEAVPRIKAWAAESVIVIFREAAGGGGERNSIVGGYPSARRRCFARWSSGRCFAAAFVWGHPQKKDFADSVGGGRRDLVAKLPGVDLRVWIRPKEIYNSGEVACE